MNTVLPLKQYLTNTKTNMLRTVFYLKEVYRPFKETFCFLLLRVKYVLLVSQVYVDIYFTWIYGKGVTRNSTANASMTS